MAINLKLLRTKKTGCGFHSLDSRSLIPIVTSLPSLAGDDVMKQAKFLSAPVELDEWH